MREAGLQILRKVWRRDRGSRIRLQARRCDPTAVELPAKQMRENTVMPQSTIAYLCECGKKWTFPRREASAKDPSTVQCVCGRTITVRDGIVYSTGK